MFFLYFLTRGCVAYRSKTGVYYEVTRFGDPEAEKLLTSDELTELGIKQ